MADKVTVGQKLATSPLHKADTINNVLDSVEDYKRRQLGRGVQTISGTVPTDLVYVRNSTGSDLLAGQVLQLDGDLLDAPNKRKLWFDGSAIDGTAQFVVLDVPLPDGKIGPAHISGVCIATVDITDTGHDRAYPVSGNDVLSSGGSGPVRILSEISGTGEQDVIVLLDYNAGTYIFVTSGTITARSGTTLGTGSATIYKISESDGSLTSIGTKTLKNWADATIASGKYGPCVPVGAFFLMLNGEC